MHPFIRANGKLIAVHAESTYHLLVNMHTMWLLSKIMSPGNNNVSVPRRRRKNPSFSVFCVDGAEVSSRAKGGGVWLIVSTNGLGNCDDKTGQGLDCLISGYIIIIITH